MIKSKKVYILFIILIFQYQTLVFSSPGNHSSLRPPSQFNEQTHVFIERSRAENASGATVTMGTYDVHAIDFFRIRGNIRPSEEELVNGVFVLAKQRREMQGLNGIHPLRVIDIGMGYGKFLAWWQAQSNVDAWGVDNSAGLLNLARQRSDIDPEKIRYSNAEALEFQDASFDIAFAHTIYHHFDDPLKAFGEVFRVLRPNGIFYVCVRCGDFRGYRNEGAGNMFYRYYESEEMKTLLLSSGFQIERIELFSDPYGRQIDFIVAIAIKHTFNLPNISTLYSDL